MSNSVILSHTFRAKNKKNNEINTYGNLKKIIVLEIIKEGNQSHFQIRKKCNDKRFKQFSNTNRKSIIRVFTQLQKDGWIGLVHINHKVGGLEKFCGLTEKGVTESLKYKLSDENFWQICINYLNKKYKYQKAIITKDSKDKTVITYNGKKECIDLTVPELFKQQYPSLDKYRDYFNPFGTNKTFGLIKGIIDSDLDSFEKFIPILNNYALGNEKLIKKSEKENNKLILKMHENKLIYSINESEKRISIFGLLSLLYVLYNNLDHSNELIGNASPNYPFAKEAEKRIRELIQKNKKLLPLVFTRWEKIKKICNDDKKLFHVLFIPFILSYQSLIINSFESSKMRILIDQYYVENDYRKKLTEIYDSGVNIGFHKWNELDYFDIDNYGNKEPFSIQNTISFYFYTQLKAYFHDNSKLLQFLKEDEEIRKWWKNWIDVITEYNKKSRESLKQEPEKEIIKN